MDLSQIDSLIERLEKKKSLRPGSPPVSISGHLGVWRTVRHNRMFIEIDSKGMPKGRVIIGPPSFVGNKLGDISGDVWANLTPRSTTKEFSNVKVADNGIETLKGAIKNATGPDDTRRDAIKSLGTVEELVPIARSTGFTDEEIKSALAGSSPNKPLEEVSGRRTAVDSTEAKPSKPAEPNNVVPLRPSDTTPKSPKESTTANEYIADALARLPEAVKGASGDDKDKAVADFLDSVVVERLKRDGPNKDERKAQAVKNLANALRTGKMTQSEVSEVLKDIDKNFKKLDLPKAQAGALEDGAKVKDLIDNFEQKLDEKINEKIAEAGSKFTAGKPGDVSDARVRELAEEARARGEQNQRDAEQQRAEAQRLRDQASADRKQAQESMSSAQKERMEVASAVALLKELGTKIENSGVKKEIRNIVDSVGTNPFNRRSILLRLYQLLQMLLLLVPGL